MSTMWDLYGGPKSGFCCPDAWVSRNRPQMWHSGGCPERCRWMVRVPRAAERNLPAGYPCPLDRDHLGPCELHPRYVLDA